MHIKTGIVLGLLAVTAAGCGSSAKPSGVASAASRAGSTSKAAAPDPTGVKYAQCMRDHGIAMRDPKPGGGISLNVPDGTDPHKVDAASNACKAYLPRQGPPKKPSPQDLARVRKMAQCMRDSGVPKFPDPDANGNIKIDGGPGLDPDSPAYQAAQKKCSKYTPGGSFSSQHQGGQ